MGDPVSLLKRLIPRLRRMARLLLSDVDEADDLVETCLRRTVESLGRSDADPHVLRLSCGHLFDSYLEAHDQVPHRLKLSQQSNGGAMAALLAELPTTVRFSLLLIVLEGMSYEDVGLVTRVPTAEVRRRVAEGRRLLSQWECARQSPPSERSIQEASPCPPSSWPLRPAPEG